jgi:hypothetical protein
VANLVPKFKSPNTSERKTPQSNSLANDEHAAIRIAPLRFAPGDRKVLHQWKKLGSPCAPGFKSEFMAGHDADDKGDGRFLIYLDKAIYHVTD